MKFSSVAVWLLMLASLCAGQQTKAAQTSPSDTPVSFQPVLDGYDHVKREVMIPMRDGVKLNTIIVVPKGAKRAPIVLDRTPYGASSATSRGLSRRIAAMVRPLYADLVQVQSSWFPLYGRNPQSYVGNIFFAKPTDYQEAFQRVYHRLGAASSIELPIIPAGDE